jgi:hypothetical protein
MSVCVMEHYKLRDLRVSLALNKKCFFFFLADRRHRRFTVGILTISQ